MDLRWFYSISLKFEGFGEHELHFILDTFRIQIGH